MSCLIVRASGVDMSAARFLVLGTPMFVGPRLLGGDVDCLSAIFWWFT